MGGSDGGESRVKVRFGPLFSATVQLLYLQTEDHILASVYLFNPANQSKLTIGGIEKEDMILKLYLRSAMAIAFTGRYVDLYSSDLRVLY